MAAQGAEADVVVLRCFDSMNVAVPVALARQRSGLVAAGAATERVVDVPGNVHGAVVAKVAAYWEGRAAATMAADKQAGAAFDAAFLVGLQHDVRVDLIYAAHHLGDDSLFGLFGFRRSLK